VQWIEDDAQTKEIPMKRLVRSAVAALLLASAPADGAQSPGPGATPPGAGPQGSSGPARRTPPTPPPEAVAACSGKAIGASCTFQHKDRTETGSCFTPDPAQAVACKPVRPPREDGPTGAR
jgi:hypothetical protein